MTTKSAPAPVATPVATPVEDTPPWIESEFVRDPAGTEAVSVAWTQIAVPYTPFSDEMSDPDEEPARAYAPWNITLRGINQEDLIDKLAEFTAMIAASDAKFITDKQFSEFTIGQRWAPQSYANVVSQPIASSPLPPAAGASHAKQPRKPGGQAAAPAQQQAPAQQRDSNDNTFLADSLLVENKINTNTKEPYRSLRLVGKRYPKYGVRVYDDKLDAVLPGWSEAPLGDNPFVYEDGTPFQVKCTFSWDAKPGKDGTPQPKNVYALELV